MLSNVATAGLPSLVWEKIIVWPERRERTLRSSTGACLMQTATFTSTRLDNEADTNVKQFFFSADKKKIIKCKKINEQMESQKRN